MSAPRVYDRAAVEHPEPVQVQRAPATILLGPGPRLERLEALLQRLGAGLPRRRLLDLDELLAPAAEGSPAPRLLLLDVDLVAPEDLGLPLRALRRHPGMSLGLLGSDSGTLAARRLLAQPGARWLAWPLDLEQIEGILPALAQPAAPTSKSPAPPAPPRGEPSLPSTPRGVQDEAIRRQVEEILGTSPRANPSPGPAATAAPEPAPRAARATAALAPTPPTGTPPAPNGSPTPAPPAPAPWFRDQVADLADVVQRAELGLAQVRAAAEGAVGGDLEERLERLSEEFVRLVQFTRTLGYLVAAPPPGAQRIEFGALLEAQLRSARSEPDCPRFLFRTTGDLWVRSERSLLTEALDALLGLAQLCAGPEGTVRVEVQAREGQGRSVEARLAFPAGPLRDLSPERILEPYGLRRILPALGANSLAAARGILVGQGGSAELWKLPDGTLEWRVILPAA